MKRSRLQIQKIEGEPIKVGSLTVTPISRRWCFGRPGWVTTQKAFFIISQRPTGVKVEGFGKVDVVPIRDYQGIVGLILLLIATLIILFAQKMGYKEKCR